MGNRKLVHGVGINDWDNAVVLNGKNIREYELWSCMLKRCFSKNYKEQRPTYNKVTCCQEWLSLKSFIKDVSQMKGYDMASWQLDKDILVKGNKLYSKETCCFVPLEVNSLLVNGCKLRGEWPIGVRFHKRDGKFVAQIRANGKERYHLGYFTSPEEAFLAYKAAKEAYIKEVANKWKDQLDERVYQALLNYTVDIAD
jgi:hypothetical protein